MPKPINGLNLNGPSYHDSSIDIFRGIQTGSHAFSELVSFENNILGKQCGRDVNGQSVLADRVCRQLLKDKAKVDPSLDLSPTSPLPGRI